jgi:peptide/nickel transport system permease protein
MQYVLRRLAMVIPMILGITIITYVIISLAPGDPVSAMINPQELNVRSDAELNQIREDLGLNDPIPVRYALWLKEAAQGNLGFSYQSKQPVVHLIADRIPETLILTCSALLLAMTIGITLGIISARKQYSALDYVLTISAFFGLSIPAFFFAMLGMFVFSVRLGWLPVFGMWTPGEPNTLNLDLLKHAVLPVSALAIPHIAEYMRYARAATLEAMGAEHVVTARAKGLRERVIFKRHVFRNALVPLLTIIGLSLPGLIGGSFVIETIFSWPGIGMLGYTAIMQRDYPVQLGIALMAAVTVLLANLLTDLAYAIADPRIRYA